MSFDKFAREQDGGEADVAIIYEIRRKCFGGWWCEESGGEIG
jgi:hypothetical protein